MLRTSRVLHAIAIACGFGLVSHPATHAAETALPTELCALALYNHPADQQTMERFAVTLGKYLYRNVDIGSARPRLEQWHMPCWKRPAPAHYR